MRQLNHLVGLATVPDVMLLKAPHHGSDNGFTAEFLRVARPEVVVISVGRNGYGHPRPAALAAYSAAGGDGVPDGSGGDVEIQGRRDGRYDVVKGHMGYGRAVWNNNGDTAALTDRTGATVIAISH